MKKLTERVRRWRMRRRAAVAEARRTSSVVVPLPAREPIPRAPLARMQYYGKKVPGRLLALGGIAGAAALAFFVRDFALRSGYFVVRDWDTIGTHRLSVAEIRRVATGLGDQEEINLFAFDAETARERLAAHPAIYSVQLRKAYPDRIEVFVHEREEAAVVVTPSHSWLADIDGVLFAEAKGEDLLDERLPLFTVSDSANLEVGSKLDAAFFDPAYLYAKTFDETDGQLAAKLSEVHWDGAAGITLFLTDGARLLCGTLPPEETLPKYEALLAKTRGTTAIDYADLRLPNDLPWRAVGAPAIAAATTTKPKTRH